MSKENENCNFAKPMLAPVIYWNRFNQVLPPEDGEYLVCNNDGVIRVSYYNGDSWGYLASVKENITHWSMLPELPL